MRCRLRSHRWAEVATRPVQWLDRGKLIDAEIRYRRCDSCGRLQRQDFWTRQYQDVDVIAAIETDPGLPPDLE